MHETCDISILLAVGTGDESWVICMELCWFSQTQLQPRVRSSFQGSLIALFCHFLICTSYQFPISSLMEKEVGAIAVHLINILPCFLFLVALSNFDLYRYLHPSPWTCRARHQFRQLLQDLETTAHSRLRTGKTGRRKSPIIIHPTSSRTLWRSWRISMGSKPVCNALTIFWPDPAYSRPQCTNFSVSRVNQYKKQLGKWGLDHKHIKDAEYQAMLKKERKREQEDPHKESAFRAARCRGWFFQNRPS